MTENVSEYFGDLKIPQKLLELFKFENEIAKKEYFADGFEFSFDKDKMGLRTYSDDEEFLSSLYEFAIADGSGSTYGFWLRNKDTDLERAPIVVFGSEGGYHIVASTLDEFMVLLAFDSEPMIDWDSVTYYKNPSDYEPSPYNSKFRDWLNTVFGIVSLENVDTIVENAQKQYKGEFDSWVHKFYQG